MNEIFSIKQLIALLSYLPVETPMLNCPTQPHKYVKGNILAMVVGETIFDRNPTKTVGEFLEMLKVRIGLEYSPSFKLTENTQVYLVQHQHQVGKGVIGFKVTSQGVEIMREPY